MSVSDVVSATSSTTIQAAGSTSAGQSQAYSAVSGRPLKRARESEDDVAGDVVGPSSSVQNTLPSNPPIATGLAAGAGKTYGSGTYGRPAPAAKPPSPGSSGMSNVNGDAIGHATQIPRERSAAAASTPSSSTSTLAPSFFGVSPPSDFVREIGDWIWGWCHNRIDVEIEAKIGLLLDTRAGLPPKSRVSFPVVHETILTDTSFARFESNMPLPVHHGFNQKLNNQVAKSQHPKYPGGRIKYLHTKEIDSFYNVQGAGPHSKVRVTRMKDTGELKQPRPSIVKSRIADMNIFSPKRAFDYRISISIEEPVDLPSAPVSHTREKDRVAYRHQTCSIDLTQVKSSENKEALHELEVEIADMQLLMQEGHKQARGEPSLYFELIEVFINNIRMLLVKGSE